MIEDLSLEVFEFLKEDYIKRNVQMFDDFRKMSAMDFVLYARRTPGDKFRTENYFDLCSESFIGKAIMWNQFYHNRNCN